MSSLNFSKENIIMGSDVDRRATVAWVDVRGAAAHLGLHQATIYQLVQKQSIPSHRIPGSTTIRFSLHELDEWLMAGK